MRMAGRFIKLIILMQQFWDQQLVFDPSSSPLMPSFQPPVKQEHYEPSECLPHSLRSLDAATKESSPGDKKRLAGQRSREKKKNYLKSLEEDVRKLSEEIDNCDTEISRCKDQLVEALKTSNNSNANQHAFTFEELQRAALAEDPNLDRVNLLIDLIRNRIGATGTERQANLRYCFKQLVNSIFPAIYRYLLNSAHQITGLFSDQDGTEEWTAEMFANMAVSQSQREQFGRLQEKFCQRWELAVDHTRRLKAAKEKIKSQGEIFEHHMGIFRAGVSPIQVALMMLFAERNKLRKELSFSEEFENSSPRKRQKAD